MTAPQLVSIVEDDDAVREATSDLLESHGYLTAAFGSAEEFLQSRQLEHTACLVTDLRLPGASGFELQQRLVDTGHRIPTIVVTAHPEEYMRKAASEIGVLAFLTKPLSEPRLLECLSSVLRSARATDTRC